MKVTVNSKDLNRLINYLPSFKDLFGEERDAAIRIISALNQGEISASHEVVIDFLTDKVRAIKYTRALFGVGLKEAKDMVDNAFANRTAVGITVGPLDFAKSLASEHNVQVLFKEV